MAEYTHPWAGDARPRRGLATVGIGLAVAAAAVAGAVAARLVLDALTGRDGVSWVLGRASGLSSYVLMLSLVVTGLVLSHPWARRLRRPGPAARLALHSTLATFTLLFTALHVVILATDPWAQVGWRGALLPMASVYRPVPVTLGVIALWAGLITGVTARWAGRLVGRIWWPVHKVAIGTLGLVWAHSVLAGTDTPLLRVFYLATGIGVAGLAITRYAARTPADKVAELSDSLDRTAVLR
jgi:F0F1-type ATP synthase membrane subunit c/vacuolar-type H+-ATPase subunit K